MTDVVYLTQEKHDEIVAELEHRKTGLRREIADKIGTAKDQGDLSENFEYQDAKEVQAENEGKIIHLEDMLSKAVIVEQEEGGDTVRMGATFTVEMPNGDKKEFQMVGAQEADPMAGKISNESPLGNAFLGAKKGDKMTIEIGTGSSDFTILDIK